jgi:hypothetical protein
MRNERKMARIDARTARAAGRQASRTEIKTTAYEMGMDPNAFISDIAKSAAEVGGKFIGAGSGIGAAAKAAAASPDSPDGGPSKSAGVDTPLASITGNPILLGAIALGAYLLLSKRKR